MGVVYHAGAGQVASPCVWLQLNNRICGVVGYHVRLTRGRAPVRSRTDVLFYKMKVLPGLEPGS